MSPVTNCHVSSGAVSCSLAPSSSRDWSTSSAYFSVIKFASKTTRYSIVGAGGLTAITTRHSGSGGVGCVGASYWYWRKSILNIHDVMPAATKTVYVRALVFVCFNASINSLENLIVQI